MLFIICEEPININSVLAFLRLSRSEFTAFSILAMEGPEAVRFVSSANIVLFRQSGKSLIYNKKSNDLKIELCGIPHLNKCSDETKLSI